jgi:predicted RNA binding protein YcfA (HicA-like mRNA interferase family)
MISPTEVTCAKSRLLSRVGKIPGVNHLHAIRALEKAGFRVVREGKHTVMSDGERILTIPRHNPVNAFTMGGIVRDAGLTPEAFRKLL